MKSARFGVQIRQISVITVLMGFVSYAFNFVVARVLSLEDAARVMTLWTVISLCLLVVQLPLELYGPRLLRLMEEHDQENHFDSLVLVYMGATSAITLILFVCYYIIRYDFEYIEVLTFVLLIGASSSFQMFRTIYIARANLQRLVRSAMYLSVGSTAVYLVVFLFDVNSTEGPLLATVFGFAFAGVMSWRFTAIRQSGIKFLFHERRICLEIFSFREVGALSLSNLVSLLLVPGGAVFTGTVGLSSGETVVYLGSTALALIPITILSSTTMPVYLRAINVFGERDMREFRTLFLKSFLFYSSASVLIVLSFSLIGQTMFLLFLGGKYQYSQTVFTFSAIAVCVSFAGSIPRLFLMALGQTRQTSVPLMLTVVLYLTLVLTIKNGFVGLYVSSIFSSLFVSLMTLILLRKNVQILSAKIS